MRRNIIFAVLLLVQMLSNLGLGWAQALPAPPDSARSYRYIETMPVFPGGPTALFKLLTDSLQYPPKALRDQVQGKVLVSFVVNPEGRVTDIAVKQGVRADLDAEALRLAQRLKRIQWQPGTQNNQPVSVSYTVPLTFSLGAPSNGSGADSLDLHPGPKLVLPVSTWTASRGPLPPDKGLVYGSCIQRLGFSSGGLLQDVRLVNLDTRKVVRVVVKPAMKSRKENEFCVALPAGRYALQQYYYSYGAESLRKWPTGPLTATRYVFVVQAGQLNYVGTWDFSVPQQPGFRIDQTALDERINPTYRKLGFADAVLAVPK